MNLSAAFIASGEKLCANKCGSRLQFLAASPIGGSLQASPAGGLLIHLRHICMQMKSDVAFSSAYPQPVNLPRCRLTLQVISISSSLVKLVYSSPLNNPVSLFRLSRIVVSLIVWKLYGCRTRISVNVDYKNISSPTLLPFSISKISPILLFCLCRHNFVLIGSIYPV